MEHCHLLLKNVVAQKNIYYFMLMVLVKLVKTCFALINLKPKSFKTGPRNCRRLLPR